MNRAPHHWTLSTYRRMGKTDREVVRVCSRCYAQSDWPLAEMSCVPSPVHAKRVWAQERAAARAAIREGLAGLTLAATKARARKAAWHRRRVEAAQAEGMAAE